MKRKKWKKFRHLSDTCSLCKSPVWQYAEDGKAFCEAHARWQQLIVERMRHPLDAEHQRLSVSPLRLRRAERRMVDIIKRIGYAEALWVAEHLAFENSVQWWDGKLYVRLSDLQLIAFSAAMRAHHEAIYPTREDPKKLRVRTTHAESRKKKKQALRDTL